MVYKKIKTTIIIGVFLTISLLFVIWLIPFNLKETLDAFEENAKNSELAQEKSEMIIVYGIIIGTYMLGIMLLAYVPAILAIFNSIISLFFSINNRFSCLKSIRIINYIYDGLLVAIIIFCIVKIVLFSIGAG